MNSGLRFAELNENLDKAPSSPRRRGPSVVDRETLGSRLRGNDDDLNANVILYEALEDTCASFSRWQS
jgi:hypothetical protein